MNISFRKFVESDKNEIVSMMKTFYSSDAVYTNGNLEIFCSDFDTCVSNSPFLDGYVFLIENNIVGYAMIAHSFSTEFGKPCLWLEDLYLKENYRGKNIVPKFIEYIENNNSNVILRLEVEEENSHAVHVYQKRGFSSLPYLEMKKEI